MQRDLLHNSMPLKEVGSHIGQGPECFYGMFWEADHFQHIELAHRLCLCFLCICSRPDKLKCHSLYRYLPAESCYCKAMHAPHFPRLTKNQQQEIFCVKRQRCGTSSGSRPNLDQQALMQLLLVNHSYRNEYHPDLTS